MSTQPASHEHLSLVPHRRSSRIDIVKIETPVALFGVDSDTGRMLTEPFRRFPQGTPETRVSAAVAASHKPVVVEKFVYGK